MIYKSKFGQKIVYYSAAKSRALAIAGRKSYFLVYFYEKVSKIPYSIQAEKKHTSTAHWKSAIYGQKYLSYTDAKKNFPTIANENFRILGNFRAQFRTF